MTLKFRGVFQIAYTDIRIFNIYIVLKDGRMDEISKRVRV